MSKNDLPAPEQKSGGVLEHLEALRQTVFKALLTLVLFLVPGWIFAPAILEKLLAYAAPEKFKLHYFSLMEPFFVQLELSLVLATAAAFPFILYYLWQFVAPALHPGEKRTLKRLIFFPVFLGLAGGAVALFFMIPAVVNFSISFATHTISPVIGIGNFVSLLLGMLLAGAVMFQFPLVIYALLATELVSLETMHNKRPVFIVIILIVAGILTPPDVASQLLLAIPSWLLFELSLLLFAIKKRS